MFRNNLIVKIFIWTILNALIFSATALPATKSKTNNAYIDPMLKMKKDFEESKYKAFKQFNDEELKLKAAQNGEPQGSEEDEIRDYENSLSAADNQAEVRRLMLYRSLANAKTWYDDVNENPAWHALLNSSFIAVSPLALSQLAASEKLKNLSLPEKFEVDPDALSRVTLFLRKNVTGGGMPLSYYTPKNYWKHTESLMNEMDSVLERLLVRYSLSVYDGALWQMAMMVSGDQKDKEAVDKYTQRLISGRSGTLEDIRAYGPKFRYGEKKNILTKEKGYFFRIIADEYLQEDPLDRGISAKKFPNFNQLHHEDWKPITGEQAWAAIIGPLQTAYMKYDGNIPSYTPEMRLALSVLSATELMRSPIGAIYHAPGGTHGKNPHDISNENNFSMYAALKMLQEAAKYNDPRTSERLRDLYQAQEEYFKKYAYDKKRGVFYQGGLYLNGKFVPEKTFAVDCQTWGINIMGPKWIDQEFGEGASYEIWQNTKKRAGFFDREGLFRGVGFTDGHRIFSVEWTCGGILTAKILANYYRVLHPSWSKSLSRDIVLMRYGVENYKMKLRGGSEAYLYANDRYFIPYGWWANPIPSTASSAWIILNDYGFNPFVLGGGKDFRGSTSENNSLIAVDEPKNETAEEKLPQEVLKNLSEKNKPVQKNILEAVRERINEPARSSEETVSDIPGRVPDAQFPAQKTPGKQENAFISIWPAFRFFIQNPFFILGEETGKWAWPHLKAPRLKFDFQKNQLENRSEAPPAFYPWINYHGPGVLGQPRFKNSIEEESLPKKKSANFSKE